MRRSLPLLILVLAMVLPIALRAQSQAPVRTVHGEVVDKDGNLLQNAVVQLRNLKTQTIRSYISDEQGEYRFSGLDPNLDYEIHAETTDMTSAPHKISSFDSRKEIDLTIRVDKKKTEK